MTSDRMWLAHQRDAAWTPPPADPGALAFHRQLDGYAMTPLVELPLIARELGVGRVFAKDESQRLGLPAFKALGASWAVRRAIDELGGNAVGEARGGVTIVTATDGNHGRAVARIASRFGHRATVFVPDGVHANAVAAIRDEGADVRHVEGTYDDAVRAAALLGDEDGHVLVQDTAWDGYEQVPAWIVDGYDTLFVEIDDQLDAHDIDHPDLVVVPTGVGSLLQAALVHHRRSGADPRTAVVSVEPVTAACVFASLAAGRPVTVQTAITSMAGLNCGTVSTIAWPAIVAGLDAALLTDDASAAAAGDALAAMGLDAGPCGAASLAALRDVLGGSDAAALRQHVHLEPTSTIVLLITESTAANPSRHH